MKQSLLILASLVAVHFSIAQNTKTDTAKGASNQEKKWFYKFLVPAAINGSDIAPAAKTSFNVDVGDASTEFKYGRPFKKATTQNLAETDDGTLENSWFISGEVGAVDGVSTLFKFDGAKAEVTAKGGFTFITDATTWTWKNTDIKSSERFQWVNVIPKISFANLNVFSNDTTYVEKSKPTYSVMASWNVYWQSVVPGFKWLNGILSVGLGAGRINNYKSLDEITLEKGIVYTTPGYSYLAKKDDDVEGRLGTFREFTAGLYDIEIYKSLHRDSTFTWYVGPTLNGYVGKERSANLNLGTFFSFSGKGDDGGREEKFGFAVVAGLRNIEDVFSGASKFSKKFGVTLSASIPLNYSMKKKAETAEATPALL